MDVALDVEVDVDVEAGVEATSPPRCVPEAAEGGERRPPPPLEEARLALPPPEGPEKEPDGAPRAALAGEGAAAVPVLPAA